RKAHLLDEHGHDAVRGRVVRKLRPHATVARGVPDLDLDARHETPRPRRKSDWNVDELAPRAASGQVRPLPFGRDVARVEWRVGPGPDHAPSAATPSTYFPRSARSFSSSLATSSSARPSASTSTSAKSMTCMSANAFLMRSPKRPMSFNVGTILEKSIF